jgi:PPOX class probable F420-dependent enzyme
MPSDAPLPAWYEFVAPARRATLATTGPDGRPSLVPICFVVLGTTVYSPLDEKPKRTADPHDLRRVRHLLADPRSTLLVDRWDEDWTRLAFVELAVTGSLLEAGAERHLEAVHALREKYPQYAAHRLEERPMLRFDATGVVARWGASEDPAVAIDQPRSS